MTSASPGQAPGKAAPAGVPGQRVPEQDAPELDASATPPGRPRWWYFPRTRRYLSRYVPAGLTGALACYCLSLTPSLLPRAWYLQAVMSAVTVAIGYGIGLLIGWLLRSLIPWRPGPGLRRTARWALAAGVTQPTSPMRSGGPDSLAPWDTLGRQGRTFVAGGPTADEIARFTGRPAMEPIRVYAGLKSAPSIEDEATLALRELERTGAFNRKVLVVATTTGTGWVNPAIIDPLEYMYGGDTAVAAIQYSFLPSWITFLVDKGPAQEAGRDLFDAVYGTWSRLPAGHRPKLVIFGESLGSFGGEAAFSGVNDIRNRTSGVLWTGPTNDNTLWSQFTADREPGTPEWQPVYRGGTTVRFITAPGQLSPVPADWAEPRVVYLQNTSDPIVWWSWQLAFHEPDWLRGSPPPDVSPAMHWYPLVTFWQVAADLALATAVPPGHGHTYGMEQGAAAWAAIVPPAGWTPERTAALGNLAVG